MNWTRNDGVTTACIRGLNVVGAVAGDQWPRDNPAWFAVITTNRLHIVEPDGTHSIIGPYKANLLRVSFTDHKEIVLCLGDTLEMGLVHVSLMRVVHDKGKYRAVDPVCAVTMTAAWVVVAAVAISASDYMLVTLGYGSLWVSVERDRDYQSTTGHSIALENWDTVMPQHLVAQRVGNTVHVYSPCGNAAYSISAGPIHLNITPRRWGHEFATSITHCDGGWDVLRGINGGNPHRVTLRRTRPGTTDTVTFRLAAVIRPGVPQHGGNTTCALCRAVGQPNALAAACHCLRRVPNAALVLYAFAEVLPREIVTFILALVGVY